jgi:pimeloyl-ACP methyl ester carboxylesterase
MTVSRSRFLTATAIAAAATAVPIAINAQTTQRNVVLVHGAWADGSSWAKVIPLLEVAGLNVVAVQNQMLHLPADAANTRATIDALTGPTTVVGHSYGGAVMTEAASGAKNVTGLVYVAAFAPDAGESLGAINARFTPPAAGKFIAPGPGGLLYVDRANMAQAFAADLPAVEGAVLAAVQRPVAPDIFGESVSSPAWKIVKSWYQVSTNDRMIDPGAERFMAQRMGAETISLPASHASMLSHPHEIANLILRAVQSRT